MDGSGSPVAPDMCDAEKMPSEAHPDGCVVECPAAANATNTETEQEEGSGDAAAAAGGGDTEVTEPDDSSDDCDCEECYEDAWIFGEEARAAAEAAEAALADDGSDAAAGNGTEDAGDGGGGGDPNGKTRCLHFEFMASNSDSTAFPMSRKVKFNLPKRSQRRTCRVFRGGASRSPCRRATTPPSDAARTGSTRPRVPSEPDARDAAESQSRLHHSRRLVV